MPAGIRRIATMDRHCFFGYNDLSHTIRTTWYKIANNDEQEAIDLFLHMLILTPDKTWYLPRLVAFGVHMQNLPNMACVLKLSNFSSLHKACI